MTSDGVGRYPFGMEDETSADKGTVMRRSTFEGYAKAAGFDGVEILPIEHDSLRFYRLDGSQLRSMSGDRRIEEAR